MRMTSKVWTNVAAWRSVVPAPAPDRETAHPESTASRGRRNLAYGPCFSLPPTNTKAVDAALNAELLLCYPLVERTSHRHPVCACRTKINSPEGSARGSEVCSFRLPLTGAAHPVVLEGGPAFELARNSEPARSAAAVTRRAGAHAENPRQRVDGGGRPCPPDAGARPAIIIPPSERPGEGRVDGGSEAARRCAILRPGVEGAAPPASPMSDIGYAGSSPPSCEEPAFVL